MRHARILPILALMLVASCATTPMGRAYQYGVAIKGINEQATLALDYGILKADDAELVQAATRTATADLKRAVTDINAGQPASVTDRLLDAILAALNHAQVILARKGVK